MEALTPTAVSVPDAIVTAYDAGHRTHPDGPRPGRRRRLRPRPAEPPRYRGRVAQLVPSSAASGWRTCGPTRPRSRVAAALNERRGRPTGSGLSRRATVARHRPRRPPRHRPSHPLPERSAQHRRGRLRGRGAAVGAGEVLYGDVAWVDRPQGLLLAYRLVAATAWDPMARLLADGRGRWPPTVAIGAAAWALAGRRAAVIAAALFALLLPGAAPRGLHRQRRAARHRLHVDRRGGQRPGGRRRRDRRLLAAAGASGAVGLLMKQSADRRPRRRGRRRVGDGRRRRRNLPSTSPPCWPAPPCLGLALIARRVHRAGRLVVRAGRAPQPDRLD